MSTFESEVREYENFASGTLKPNTTRGLVVSTIDPMFSGRVKVWIPAIHGASPYGITGQEDPDDNDLPENFIPGVSGSGQYKNKDTISGLPWAKVLSHNLGPNADIQTGLSNPAGIFSTPCVGTEVIIMFENDDPTLPIIVGSIIHANEFRYSLARPLEYLPGVLLSKPKQTDSEKDKATATPNDILEYEDTVSTVYNLRTNSGSTLFISDDPVNRAIVLEGAVAFGETSTLTTIEEAQLSRLYPAFPTTASAAFSKRQILSRSTVSPLVVPSLPSVTNDTTNSVTITTITPQPTSNEAAKKEKEAQAASGKVSKCWPVGESPRWSSGLGRFGTQRPKELGGKVHVGIDIAAHADGSTLLVAPIDCYPLYTTTSLTPGVGTILLVRGIDGYGHSFVHLKSVDPFIKAICQSGKTELVKMGTRMGVCGISEKSTHNSGPHLHWEVFSAGDAWTGISLMQTRERLRKQEPLPSGMISGQDWMKFSEGNTNGMSVVVVSREQAQRIFEYNAVYSKNSESDFAKPAGLEMSLTPGKETIAIRHPSGSFIGFDPDGNILIYSCGDINFRANRSITYDVFGAILENAFAKYTRVKTVLKSWARVTADRGYKKVSDTDMPEFFSRVDQSRAIDMANALTSNLGNSFILDSNNTLVDPNTLMNSLQNQSSSFYVTQPELTKDKNYSLATWDSTLKAAYAKYIKTNKTAFRVFPDVTDFKSLMLHESDGNERAQSPTGATGLFQLTGVALREVLGYNLSAIERSEYYKGAKNTEVAFQYIIKLVEYIRRNLDSLGIDPDTISATDYRYLVTISYNQGPTATNKAIKKVKEAGQPITYKNVENLGIVTRSFKREALIYVPTIELIKEKATKVV
jgi:murein DD-endopeptidase MepM/ murein hydrolase activator NlpD